MPFFHHLASLWPTSLTREAFTLLEDVLEGGLEEAVAHLVAVPVVPRQVLERDLLFGVAVPLLRREPQHGVLGGADEGRGDGDLVLRAGGDVEAGLPHDGHVQVVHQGDLRVGRVGGGGGGQPSLDTSPLSLSLTLSPSLPSS